MSNEVENLKLQLKQLAASNAALDQSYGESIRVLHQVRTELVLMREQLQEVSQREARLKADLDAAKKELESLKPVENGAVLDGVVQEKAA